MMVTDLSRGRRPALPAPAAEVAGNGATMMSRVEAESSISGMKRHIDTAQANLCNANTIYVRFVDRQGWKVLGYKSLDECRKDRFPWMSERSWWQLEAASRVSQNLGLSDAMAIPVDTLAPLGRVPAAEQAEVWAEATGGDPEAVPTQREVRDAVKGHLEKKDEALAKMFADETEDGTVTRTTVGREPGDDDEAYSEERQNQIDTESFADPRSRDEPTEASNPEDDFISQILANEKCPHHALDDVRGKRFVAGAIRWFRLQSARKAYQVQIAEQSNSLRRECPGAVDPYLEKQTYVIGIKGPQQWKLCSDCGGTGRRVVANVTMSGCGSCNGAGWKI